MDVRRIYIVLFVAFDCGMVWLLPAEAVTKRSCLHKLIEQRTSGNANISSRPVRHRTEPMEPRRSGSVHLRMEMPVSIQRASETSRAREIDLAHAGFWYLGVVRPPRAGACAPTTLEPTVESGQTVEGGPRRCTLRTETTSPFGSCRSARKPISVRKFPTFLMGDGGRVQRPARVPVTDTGAAHLAVPRWVGLRTSWSTR